MLLATIISVASVHAVNNDTIDGGLQKTGVGTACCTGLLSTDTITTPLAGNTTSTYGGLHKAGTVSMQGAVNAAVAAAASVSYKSELYAMTSGSGTFTVPMGATRITVWMVGGGGGGSTGYSWNPKYNGNYGGPTCFNGTCAAGGGGGNTWIESPGGAGGYTSSPWGNVVQLPGYVYPMQIYPPSGATGCNGGAGGAGWGGGGGAGGRYAYGAAGQGGLAGQSISFVINTGGGMNYSYSIGGAGAGSAGRYECDAAGWDGWSGAPGVIFVKTD